MQEAFLYSTATFVLGEDPATDAEEQQPVQHGGGKVFKNSSSHALGTRSRCIASRALARYCYDYETSLIEALNALLKSSSPRSTMVSTSLEAQADWGTSNCCIACKGHPVQFDGNWSVLAEAQVLCSGAAAYAAQ